MKLDVLKVVATKDNDVTLHSIYNFLLFPEYQKILHLVAMNPVWVFLRNGLRRVHIARENRARSAYAEIFLLRHFFIFRQNQLKMKMCAPILFVHNSITTYNITTKPRSYIVYCVYQQFLTVLRQKMDY